MISKLFVSAVSPERLFTVDKSASLLVKDLVFVHAGGVEGVDIIKHKHLVRCDWDSRAVKWSWHPLEGYARDSELFVVLVDSGPSWCCVKADDVIVIGEC